MHKLTILIALTCAISFGAVRKYRATKDASSDTVTTTFELMLTNTKPVKKLFCSHTADQELQFSVSGNESDCSDAATDFMLPTGQGAFFINDWDYPLGLYVCVKTTSGTTTAGTIQCSSSFPGADG